MYQNFLDVYVSNIYEKLKEIDLLVKTAEGGIITVHEAAAALCISTDSIRAIMAQKNISRLTKKAFFVVMAEGESDICALYQREVRCGSPFTYTREDVAYIYDLNLDTINETCDKLGIRAVSAHTLPALFARLPA